MKLDAAKIQTVLVSVLFIGLAILYYRFPAYTAGIYPACIFHRLTGLFCPGCGSQRAGSALLHGHFAAAAGYNLLFVCCLPLVSYSAFVFGWNAFSQRKLSQAFFYSPLFTKSLLFLVLLFAVLRNLPLEPFRWLSPNS